MCRFWIKNKFFYLDSWTYKRETKIPRLNKQVKVKTGEVCHRCCAWQGKGVLRLVHGAHSGRWSLCSRGGGGQSSTGGLQGPGLESRLRKLPDLHKLRVISSCAAGLWATLGPHSTPALGACLSCGWDVKLRFLCGPAASWWRKWQKYCFSLVTLLGTLFSNLEWEMEMV